MDGALEKGIDMLPVSGTRHSRLARSLTATVVIVVASCQYIGASPSPFAGETPPPSDSTPSTGNESTPQVTPTEVPSPPPATPTATSTPRQTVEARLQDQANQALARWAEIVGDAPPNAVVFTEDVTDGGGWRGRGANDRKIAFLSGYLRATVDLPTEPPPPADVIWSDGSATTVSLFSAAEALEDLVNLRGGGSCDTCYSLEVVGAELVMGEAETSHGTATVPLWKFAFATRDKPLQPITHVAVKDRVVVFPAEEWDPYGDNPIGTQIEAAYGSSEDSEFTVEFTGSPWTGESWCGADYAAEAIESDLAIVVIIRGLRDPAPDSTPPLSCDLVGARRTAVVTLDSPIAIRTVLEVQFGTPVALIPEEPPSDAIRE